jgi:hypothetical protein
MELGLLASIAYLGSKNATGPLEKPANNKDYSNTKSHKIKFTYNDDRYNENKNTIANITEKRFRESYNPKNTNIINNKIKNPNEIKKISSNNKIMNTSKFYNNGISSLDNSNLFESFDNNVSNLDSNMSFNDQFKPLIFDNKDPPKPINVTHNSIDINKRTSIERSLAIDGGWSAFDNKSIDMSLGVKNLDNMTHNNMVPHFKNKGAMINNYNEQNIAHRVDLFSGSSRNFIPKKEILQENFKPMEAGVNLVNGQGSFIDKIEGYYLPSKERRNETPFESTKVGPGLNLDPSQSHRPDGGAHDEYRPLPKNTNNLRSADNPKVSYEGVVIPGQKGSKKSIIGKVYKRRPEKTKEMNPDQLQKAGGAFRKPTSRDKIIIKNTNRKTSNSFFGPATFEVNKILSSKNKGKVQKSKKQQFKNKDPSNLKFHVSKNNQNTKSYNILETERDTTQDNEHPQGLHRSDYGVNVYNPNDSAKQTIKQTTVFNQQSGIAKGQNNKSKPFNPKDIARPTTKQTTLHNKNNGNVGRSDIKKVSSYNPNDEAKTTHRQTTLFNKYDGGVQGPVKNTKAHDPNSSLRPTIRQTSAYNSNKGNIGRSDTNRVIAYDPNQEPNPTHRQTTQFNEHEGMVRAPNNKGEVYDPSNIAKPTIRETTGHNNFDGNVSGPVNKGQTYDPNQSANVTNRQTTQHNEHILNTHSSVHKVRSFDPRQQPKDTMKELNIHNADPTNVKGSNSNPHHHNPNDVPNRTLREQNPYTNQEGGVQGINNKGIPYNPNDTARITGKQGLIHDQHTGTGRGQNDKPHYYNPADTARITGKQGLIHDQHTGTGRGQIDKPHYYNPADEAKTTIKQTTIYSDNGGNIKSAYNKPNVFNPNDVPATTLKDMLVHQYNIGVAHGSINKSVAFNPNDIPADTLKQMLVINNYMSNVNKEGGDGYLSNKFTAPDTLRQLMNILRSGGLKGNDMPADYTAEKNMQQDIRREMISKSRDPTNRGADNAPIKGNIGSAKLRDPINIQRDPIRNIGNQAGNNFKVPPTQTRTNFRQEESNRLDPEILTQLIDNPLVNNIVNRRLNKDY